MPSFEEVCTEKRCFIFRRPYAKAAFNDEHIVPDWLQSRFNLHGAC
jgi:hypothetical protein